MAHRGAGRARRPARHRQHFTPSAPGARTRPASRARRPAPVARRLQQVGHDDPAHAWRPPWSRSARASAPMPCSWPGASTAPRRSRCVAGGVAVAAALCGRAGRHRLTQRAVQQRQVEPVRGQRADARRTAARPTAGTCRGSSVVALTRAAASSGGSRRGRRRGAALPPRRRRARRSRAARALRPAPAPAAGRRPPPPWTAPPVTPRGVTHRWQPRAPAQRAGLDARADPLRELRRQRKQGAALERRGSGLGLCRHGGQYRACQWAPKCTASVLFAGPRLAPCPLPNLPPCWPTPRRWRSHRGPTPRCPPPWRPTTACATRCASCWRCPSAGACCWSRAPRAWGTLVTTMPALRRGDPRGRRGLHAVAGLAPRPARGARRRRGGRGRPGLARRRLLAGRGAAVRQHQGLAAMALTIAATWVAVEGQPWPRAWPSCCR
jgi:hypothetical protein